MIDRELTPSQVAECLGIPVSRARRYMAEGVIRSHVSTKAKGGRVYRRTFESEVDRYRKRVGKPDANPDDTDSSRSGFSPISYSELWN